MRFVIRGLAALFALVAVHFFVFWMSRALLYGLATDGRVFTIGAFVIAIGAAVYVWRATASLSAGLGTYMLSGAFLVGSAEFVGGFFGPMIFDPGANQGPLLGIFITAPAGFVLGAVAGGVYWHQRRRSVTGRIADV